MKGYDLVALGRQPHTGWSGRLSANDHAEIERALRDANAIALADRLVAELSDGERQRILIARALAQQPRTIVLDEPTAFLDLPRRVELMDMLRRLAHERGIGVLLSIHDLELALRYADDIWLLGPDGEFFRGAPEDLVLSGTFEKAFAREGFFFDLEHGALRLRETHTTSVAIEAEPPYNIWLARAAARAGFRTDPSAGIRIMQDGRQFRVTSHAAAPILADNIAMVVDALRALRPS
jgi:iron complex transport system ATP-binding protein